MIEYWIEYVQDIGLNHELLVNCTSTRILAMHSLPNKVLLNMIKAPAIIHSSFLVIRRYIFLEEKILSPWSLL